MTHKIRKQLKELKKIFNKTDYDNYIYGKITFTDMLKKYHSSEYLFDLLFKEMNLKKRRDVVAESVVHNFFDKIDEEIKAYLLGFYYADGYLNKQRKRIKISINHNDIEIIELFKTFIAPMNIIGDYIRSSKNKNQTYSHFKSIQIYSPHITETLTNYGMGNRKTYIPLKDLSFINDNMMRHFIRGYFDGDGCVYFQTAKRKQTLKNGIEKEYKNINYLWYMVSYTKEHLEILKKWLETNDIYPNIYTNKANNYLLSVTKKDSFFKLRELLYQDANFFLKRKKDKFFSVDIEMADAYVSES